VFRIGKSIYVFDFSLDIGKWYLRKYCWKRFLLNNDEKLQRNGPEPTISKVKERKVKK